jgi:DNA-directed RNA polymerase specialized sigma24 family protein
MARIVWVRQRLNEWARWKAQDNAGSLGYAKASILLRTRVDCDTTPHAQIDESRAHETDQAVEALKLGKGHLARTVELCHLHGLPVHEAAKHMQKGRSTVHTQLEQADHALQEWFALRTTTAPSDVVTQLVVKYWPDA